MGFLAKWREKLSQNHGLLMALCIGPWIVLAGLYAVGFQSPLLWPAALVLCIGSHVLMMAAHGSGGKSGKNKDAQKTCH